MLDKSVSADGMKFLSEISVITAPAAVVVVEFSCCGALLWLLMRVMQRIILRSSAGQPRNE